ncbi:hypothetical protein A5821_000655 [Enterococcus sp. 7F3_DIV0205]|uniref:VOC domain-containing protein n=1 Tax=Candidatus Enterococcus palustris TaxID=1834189 RepID=A0AAQ3W6A7_9ENTE|nr:VOC family protein [Enterococcus sp. 7F3_DIV0205]OTN85069.1 hypothetical protein A5821_000998 [Enterococcus sp. 7F3_DIV0205]
MSTTFRNLQIGINPVNFEKSKTFYEEILELPYIGVLETNGISLHRFSIDGSILKLLEAGIGSVEKNPLGGPTAATGLRWLTVTVSDLDRLFEKVSNAGIPVVAPISSDENGVRFAIVEDPDGIWVELLDR